MTMEIVQIILCKITQQKDTNGISTIPNRCKKFVIHTDPPHI